MGVSIFSKNSIRSFDASQRTQLDLSDALKYFPQTVTNVLLPSKISSNCLSNSTITCFHFLSTWKPERLQIISQTDILSLMMMMMMMMMMMNCFCNMVDQRKVFSSISSWDHCQRSSPSPISGTHRAGFEPAQNLSLSLRTWLSRMKLCSSDNHYTTAPQVFMPL